MPDLSIHLVVGVLLSTTFACFGLLGIWVGTSRWHWFIRSSIAVAAFLPIVLIPADGAMLLLLMELLFCAAGSKAYLVAKEVRKQAKEGAGVSVRSLLPRLRCSVADLLLATVLAAMLLTVLVRMSAEELLYGLPGYMLTGCGTGCIVLASAWLVCGRAALTARLGIACLASLFASCLLAYFEDWPKIVTGFPQKGVFLGWPSLGVSEWTLIWFPIALGIASLVLATLWLLRKSQAHLIIGCGPTWESGSGQPLRASYGIACALLVSLMALPPAATCWELLHPLEMPRKQPPEPNGYDTLVSAGQKFNSPILSMAVAPGSTEQLADEVEKYADVYGLVAEGLSSEFASPRWYSEESAEETEVACIDARDSFRSIARALSMKCELARKEGRFEDAATTALAGVQLGLRAGQDGVLSDYLVGTAIEGIGTSDLASALGELEPNRYQDLVDQLLQLHAERESLDAVLHRDRIWDENAHGWEGHLFEWLWDFAGGLWLYDDLRDTIHPKRIAMSRLLVVEIALQAYRAEHGEYPGSLNGLVPEILPQMVDDPFNNQGGPFVYRRTEDGYSLYSLGQNRRDDGGVGQDKTVDGYIDWDTGDLRLKDD